MLLLLSMHVLTEFKYATPGKERHMVCQAFLAKHVYGGCGGMTVVAAQEGRGDGK